MNRENLRKAREMLGWSIYDMGNKLGLTPAYISQIELGKKPLTKSLERRFMEAMQLDEEEINLLAELHKEIRGNRPAKRVGGRK